MSETVISVLDSEALIALFGTCDRHVRRIREAFGVRISARDGRICIEGDQESVARATEVLEQLRLQASRYGSVAAEDVARAVQQARQGTSTASVAPFDVYTGRTVRPRTAGQARYVEAIRANDIVFCTGPAGTGKTYLAVAAAAAALKAGQVRKIVLVRPAVEAGESLGFLPGDLHAKINPYLRPLFDALREMIEHEMMRRFMEEDLIEVVPLAYMRGRTLNEAFIILDEGQNTTIAQMKMFLTRMGIGSKVVVSGDVTQVDLPDRARSGLLDALGRLQGIPRVAMIQLTAADIVRHELVQAIVDAYERSGRKRRH